MPDTDLSSELAERVADACAAGAPLFIEGGGTKRFYGREVSHPPLSIADHRGIVDYDPAELVITARAGTPLQVVEAELAGHEQQLAFEPPHFGAGATVGGVVATGLAGPRRPYVGGVRDFVLGVRLINGRGERLRFGGTVMKNVAGFDVSRVMAGSLGCLGVILDVSLKVLPRAGIETTRILELTPGHMIEKSHRFLNQGLPLSAAAHVDGQYYLRLSGGEAAVAASAAQVGGEPGDGSFWHALKEHRLSFFDSDGPCWRISLPPATPPLALSGEWLIDWGGAQRWLRSDLSADEIRRVASAVGGHATLFYGDDADEERFHPLDDVQSRTHRALKKAFDPSGILNPGRMYREI